MLLPDAAASTFSYLMLWTGMAVLAAVVTGAEMIARTRRIHGGFADEIPIIDGHVRLPEEPGIGIELKRDLYAAFKELAA